MTTFARLVREPLLHFAVLGAAMFALYAAVRAPEAATAPVPEVDRRIALGAAELARLEEGFRRSYKRPPEREELAELALEHVGEEMLYREARALGLERGDVVVRRRLIENMTQLVRAPVPPGEPGEAELRAWFLRRRHRFAAPPQVWFDQVFFDPNTRRAAVNDAAREALASLRDPTAPTPPTGDAFVLPARIEGKSDLQIAHLFGEGFVKPLAEAPLGRWVGPLSSQHGLHLVRVSRREPARAPSFEEARASVRADWLTEKTRGLVEATESLLPRFRVELDPGARVRLAGTPVLEALEGRAAPGGGGAGRD